MFSMTFVGDEKQNARNTNILNMFSMTFESTVHGGYLGLSIN